MGENGGMKQISKILTAICLLGLATGCGENSSQRVKNQKRVQAQTVEHGSRYAKIMASAELYECEGLRELAYLGESMGVEYLEVSGSDLYELTQKEPKKVKACFSAQEFMGITKKSTFAPAP